MSTFLASLLLLLLLLKDCFSSMWWDYEFRKSMNGSSYFISMYIVNKIKNYPHKWNYENNKKNDIIYMGIKINITNIIKCLNRWRFLNTISWFYLRYIIRYTGSIFISGGLNIIWGKNSNSRIKTDTKITSFHVW